MYSYVEDFSAPLWLEETTSRSLKLLYQSLSTSSSNYETTLSWYLLHKHSEVLQVELKSLLMAFKVLCSHRRPRQRSAGERCSRRLLQIGCIARPHVKTCTWPLQGAVLAKGACSP